MSINIADMQTLQEKNNIDSSDVWQTDIHWVGRGKTRSEIWQQLPNQRPSFLLRYMIDADFAQFFRRNPFARLKQIYLQAHFDLLGQGAFGEDGLDLGHHRAGHHATFRTDGVHFLTYPGHDREILRKVLGHYSGDPAWGHVFHLIQIYDQKK